MVPYSEVSANENWLRPQSISLEASSLCQLNCADCYVRKAGPAQGIAGKGYLKFSDFEKFIQNHPFVKRIELANNGEIFLNPDLIHIIKYAHERNIALSALTGTNFNTVSDDIAEALVKYGFKNIAIALDGASQETYARYRIKGNFETVIGNVRKVNAYKEKYKTTLPGMVWQFVLMEHNETEVAKAKAMAKDLGMMIKFKLPWGAYAPKNPDMLRRETGLQYLTRQEWLENENIVYMAQECCGRLLHWPQINWDGRLLGCDCFNPSDFGVNVFEIGLEAALSAENYRIARKMVTGEIDAPNGMKNLPCLDCDKYKAMKESGAWAKPHLLQTSHWKKVRNRIRLDGKFDDARP